MAHHVMIDLESLGTQPNSALLSLGAVKFDINTLEMVEQFYCNFRLKGQQEKGRTLDLDTVRWWMQQSDEARSIFEVSQEDSNEQCLTKFNAFLSGPEKVEGVWGNGAAFDNVLLKSFYRDYDIKPAWNFRQDFCFRTFNTLFATEATKAMTRTGVAHNALDDAVFQTEILFQLITGYRMQVNNSLMFSRLMTSMSGMIQENVTADDLMNMETSDESASPPLEDVEQDPKSTD